MEKSAYIILISLILCSCSLEPLYYGGYERAIIKLDIDWSKLEVAPNGATVYIYTKDGKLYRNPPPLANPQNIKITLPLGNYEAIIISNTPEEYSINKFKEMENIENAKALLSYSNTISKAQKSKVFAFSYIDNINIDKSITHLYTLKPNINKDSSVVKYHSTATIPHKKLTFRIYVEGLIYAAKLPQVYFENIVDGYILSKNIIANTSRHIKFIPDEIYIEKNNISNGTVSRTLNVFDITDKNGKNLIKLDFTLKDGSTHHIEMDASKHIQREDKEIYIEISIKLPKVEIDNDMPFKPDIDDWKDIEIDTPV